MPDEAVAPETEAPASESTEETPAAQESDKDWAAEAEKWKALARKHETNAKSNAEAAKAWAEYQQSQKTEEEKRSEALTAAEKRAAELEDRLMRMEIAQEKGLTPAQVKRLVGSTREELEADADELLATFAPADKPKPANPDAGPRSSAPTEVSDNDLDPEAYIKKYARRRT